MITRAEVSTFLKYFSYINYNLVQQQAAELNHMQKTILELEKVFHRMKQE